MRVVADRLSLRWCLGYDLGEPYWIIPASPVPSNAISTPGTPRKERLEAQRRAKQLELETGDTHRRAERPELALWETQQEARRLREELEAERSKGFRRRLFGG
jgi:hypothetical protein